MKHKTWFRLVLKAIGVLLVGLSLPDIVKLVAQMGHFSVSRSFASGRFPVPPPPNWWWVWNLVAEAIGHLLELGVGLYLLLGGKWIVNLCIPSNRPYCPECGYDLSKATSANCPECGVKLPRDNSTG
ncbi:MAG: hypothetical protein IH983_09070 [Planctomycetes bacterium]|nr:hypothetical protein [Planctomycetota bacterium]